MVQITAGVLVKWSVPWLVSQEQPLRGMYKRQIGFVIEKTDKPNGCWLVLWNDGEERYVHDSYLEVM